MKLTDAKKIMNDLQEDYNLISSSFATSRDRLWPEMKFLFDYAKENERVLDIGCGNGRFSQYLEKADYMGIDFSQKLIEEAKKRFPQKNFLMADALSLPFENESFNKVYGIAVIHHIPSFEYKLKILLEAKRVLMSGGYLFLTAWNLTEKNKKFLIKNTLQNLFSFSFSWQDFFIKRKRYYYLFKKNELSSLAKKAGFEIIEEGIIKEERRNNFYLIAKK
jgi:ubiquinone/menaquinone biosynthesis C-methylase UbiE